MQVCIVNLVWSSLLELCCVCPRHTLCCKSSLLLHPQCLCWYFLITLSVLRRSYSFLNAFKVKWQCKLHVLVGCLKPKSSPQKQTVSTALRLWSSACPPQSSVRLSSSPNHFHFVCCSDICTHLHPHTTCCPSCSIIPSPSTCRMGLAGFSKRKMLCNTCRRMKS